jgi:hypothetical protein
VREAYHGARRGDKVRVGEGVKVGVEEKGKEVSSREGGAFCKAR